jgi:hypothetical protein
MLPAASMTSFLRPAALYRRDAAIMAWTPRVRSGPDDLLRGNLGTLA